MKRETVRCLICGSADQQKNGFQKRDKFGIEGSPFRIVECAGCGFAFINPRPPLEDIGRFYPEYYQFKEEDPSAPQSFLSRFASRAEKFYRTHQLLTEICRLKQYAPRFPSKILDVGCGTGDRLNLLRKQGCDVAGVEYSGQALYAQKHFGLPVFQGTLAQAAFPDNSFDVILFHNVLEHVHDPREALREARRILRPSGMILVQLPNNRSFQARFFGPRWAAVDVPRDLYYFEETGLTRLLREAEFAPVHVDYETDFWHPPTLVISLMPFLDPQLIWSQNGKGGGMLKRALWACFTLLFAPLAWIENRMPKRGALMTFYAVKDSPVASC